MEGSSLRHLGGLVLLKGIRAFLICTTLLYISTTNCVLNNTIPNYFHSQRLEGFEFRTIAGITVESCWNECRSRKFCKSVNYHSLYFMCELNSETKDDLLGRLLVPKKNYEYFDDSNWLEHDCGCSEREVCRNYGLGNECKFEECLPKTPNITNGIVYGNMNSIHSKIAIKCNSGYINRGPNVSVCGPDGNWSQIAECLAPCRRPFIHFLQMIGAEIVTKVSADYYDSSNTTSIKNVTEILEGSLVKIQCKGNIVQPFYMECWNKVWVPSNRSCIEGNKAAACDAFNTCKNVSRHQVDACIANNCACPPYTRFSYSLQTCINECLSEYAPTFTKLAYQRAWWEETAIAEYEDLSRTECIQKCRSHANCIRIEFSFKDCRIFDIDVFDYKIVHWNDGHTYIRDCM